MEEYRVIIVGGGPSGSLTALSLLRLRPDLAGKILILEARRFPREKVCGGGVSGRVTERLESLGLPWQELPRTTVRGFTVCFRGFRYRPEFGNLKCFVTRRSLFDAFLLKCAEERGAEVAREAEGREEAPAEEAADRPRKTLSREEKLQLLEDRFLLGEISEESYREMKAKLMKR